MIPEQSDLSTIIREVNKREIDSVEAKDVIYFDSMIGKLTSRPWTGISSILRSHKTIKRYLISNDSKVDICVKNVLVYDFATGLNLELDVNCRVSIDNDPLEESKWGIEAFLIDAQAQNSLKRTFEKLVESGVKNFTDEQTSRLSFILKYFDSEVQKALKKSLKSHLSSYGFEAEVTVDLTHRQYIKDNESKSGAGYIPIKFIDCQKPINIKYKYRLDCIPTEKIRVLVYKKILGGVGMEIESELGNQLKGFKLKDFLNEIEKGLAYEILKDSKEQIRNYGYNLSLSLGYNQQELLDLKSEELTHC